LGGGGGGGGGGVGGGGGGGGGWGGWGGGGGGGGGGGCGWGGGGWEEVGGLKMHGSNPPLHLGGSSLPPRVFFYLFSLEDRKREKKCYSLGGEIKFGKERESGGEEQLHSHPRSLLYVRSIAVSSPPPYNEVEKKKILGATEKREGIGGTEPYKQKNR